MTQTAGIMMTLTDMGSLSLLLPREAILTSCSQVAGLLLTLSALYPGDESVGIRPQQVRYPVLV